MTKTPKKILAPSQKRKSPPQEQENNFEDSDFTPVEVPPDFEFEPPKENERKKTKSTATMVAPDKEPSNREADTPAPTNSVELSPERQPSNRNVAQRPKDASHEQMKAASVPISMLTSVPIKEETRKKFAAERKECFAKYGDRYLLARQDKLGVSRLGGSTQRTWPIPSFDNATFLEKIQDEDFPMPLHAQGRDIFQHNKEVFRYAAFNSVRQPNGPMFAGQRTATVHTSGKYDSYFMKTGYPFPVFMKRTLTTSDHENEGRLLGWEYVGNYKYLPKDADIEVSYESANNISKASKSSMASALAESYAKPGGDAVPWVDVWRERLILAIETETQPFPPDSLAARCLALGFTADMGGNDLCKLLVELDQYHEQKLIEFVNYDEKVYQYCIGGKTNSTKDGKSIKGGAVGGPAKAQDWHLFATINMLFKY